MVTKRLHLGRTGRPTIPVHTDQEWKTVKIHGYAWDRLAQLADEKQEPIYSLVEEALEKQFGFWFRLPPDQYQVPMCYVIERLSKRYGYPVSPRAFVSAIKKGKIWGERRKWDGKYQWIVNVNQAERWYTMNIYSKRHLTPEKVRELQVQAAAHRKAVRAADEEKRKQAELETPTWEMAD